MPNKILPFDPSKRRKKTPRKTVLRKGTWQIEDKTKRRRLEVGMELERVGLWHPKVLDEMQVAGLEATYHALKEGEFRNYKGNTEAFKFKTVISAYERRGMFDRAMELCDLAVSFGVKTFLTPGGKGFEAWKVRIERKKGKV